MQGIGNNILLRSGYRLTVCFVFLHRSCRYKRLTREEAKATGDIKRDAQSVNLTRVELQRLCRVQVQVCRERVGPPPTLCLRGFGPHGSDRGHHHTHHTLYHHHLCKHQARREAGRPLYQIPATEEMFGLPRFHRFPFVYNRLRCDSVLKAKR